jgi:hypothetical protein
MTGERSRPRRIEVFVGVAAVFVVVALLLPSDSLGSKKRRSHANPHAEITAVAEVVEAPKRTHHSNGRSFEELRVRLLTVEPPAPPEHGDASFTFETREPIRVVHDLTCGGVWVDLRPGDRVELKGEYVHTPAGGGGDLVHFTHPAGAVAGCGSGTSHPDGYLRAGARAAGIPAANAPDPAGSPPPSGLPEASVASFVRTLRPILSTRCAPCHEPGGKMYARLPFDDPQTVAAHAGRMGTRLNGDDLKALQNWSAEVAAATVGAR